MPSPTAMQVLDFRLCGRAFAIDIGRIQEVHNMAWINPVPGSPPILEGFLNLRGTLLPVLRLDRLFGFTEFLLGLQSIILVLKGPDGPMGILADEAKGILTLAESAVRPVAPDHALNDCILGAVDHSGLRLHLLSPDRLLFALESERIAGLRKLEESRLKGLSPEVRENA